MVKVVENSDETKFETECNKLIQDGYKISSTSCGIINSEAYDFCTFYQAILVKEDK